MPPQDLDAEESLLGAMLLSSDAVGVAIEVCAPGDFYKPTHGLIFSAIVSLFEAGEPVDAVTVADELRRAGALEQVGDPTVLVSLQANTPSPANAAHYARIVEEHALLRRLIGVAGELSELGYSIPDDVTAAVDEAERMVLDLAERRTTETVASLRNLIGPSLDRIEELSHRRTRITGVATGYHDLDEILAGLQPQSLTIVGARPAMGKALALDTPIPTPAGWTTMGDLRVGDEVYDDAGRACRVSYTSPVFVRHRCFRVRFDDGSSIVADAGHRWLAYDRRAWAAHEARRAGLGAEPERPGDRADRAGAPRVVTTAQMIAMGVRTAEDLPNWHVPLAGAIDGPDVALPVDPYVLGCWLGERTAPAGELPVAPRDVPHLVAELEIRGYAPAPRDGVPWAVVAGSAGRATAAGRADPSAPSGAAPMPVPAVSPAAPAAGPGTGPAGAARDEVHGDGRPPGVSAAPPRPARHLRVMALELRAVGLLDDGPVGQVADGRVAPAKRIPRVYLRASAAQRLELLQGLMDIRGTLTGRDGAVELCLSDRHLLEQAHELACSLGQKPGPPEQAPRAPGGRPVDSWRFRWTPSERVFRLDRKAELLDAAASVRTDRDHARRAVVAVEEVASVPVRCISVRSPSHLFLAGRGMTPTHNTSFGLGMLAHVGTVLRRPALLFSLEMGHVELTQRLLASEARVDSQRMRTGHLHDSDWAKVGAAVSRLSESTIFIDENPHLTVMDIRARARRVRKNEGDLGLVVVDYLQLMTGRSRAENRQVEVAEISRGLKILARELNCPVVALSQLSRNLEARQDKRPMLSDLRESGCMPASTRLLRADTGEEVTLGELVLTQAQPLVWSLDDERMGLVPRRLTAAFPSGVKPVYRLRLRSGHEVEATANHQFRTAAGWRRLDRLGPGDRLAVPRRLGAPLLPTTGWADDELVVLANLLGRGGTGPGRVWCASRDRETCEEVAGAVRRLFGIDATARRDRDAWRLRLPAPRAAGGGRHPVRHWLEPFGLWGVPPGERFVPEPVLGLGDRQLALFLGHLWGSGGAGASGSARDAAGRVCGTGDGDAELPQGLVGGAARFQTTSRRLAEGVRRALLRFGVGSVVVGRKAGKDTCFSVEVAGGPDLDALRAVLAGPGTPGPGTPGPGTRGSGTRGPEARRPDHGVVDPSAPATGGGLDDGVAPGPGASGAADVAWDEIVEIVPTGLQPTFDATVEGTHNFVADGIIAHNSLEQDADVVLFIFREELYEPDTPIDRRGLAEIIVAKHRNGPTGSARLAFLTQHARFDNLQQV